MPRLLVMEQERRDSPRYRHEGRYRQSESHCLFKYTLAGEGRFRDASGEYRVRAGQGFLCEIRDPATAYYYPADAHEVWEFLYVCFDGATATAMVHELTARCGPIFTIARESEIIERLFSWRHLSELDPCITPAEGAALVLGLLTELLATHDSEHQDAGNLLVQRAQEIVHQRLREELNATQLAALLGISREHLTRLFHAQLGQTPYRYILGEKMRVACRLLKDTELSIKEICYRTGCASPALFNRRFKELLQLTPGEFRRVGVMPVHMR